MEAHLSLNTAQGKVPGYYYTAIELIKKILKLLASRLRFMVGRELRDFQMDIQGCQSLGTLRTFTILCYSFLLALSPLGTLVTLIVQLAVGIRRHRWQMQGHSLSSGPPPLFYFLILLMRR